MMYNIRSGTIRWQIPDFLSDDNNNVCSFPTFTCKISTLKVLPSKFRQGSWSTTFTTGPFDGIYKMYKRHFYIFYLRQSTTYAHEHNRQTHTHRETNKPIAIDEILQICLKLVDRVCSKCFGLC